MRLGRSGIDAFVSDRSRLNRLIGPQRGATLTSVLSAQQALFGNGQELPTRPAENCPQKPSPNHPQSRRFDPKLTDTIWQSSRNSPNQPKLGPVAVETGLSLVAKSKVHRNRPQFCRIRPNLVELVPYSLSDRTQLRNELERVR